MLKEVHILMCDEWPEVAFAEHDEALQESNTRRCEGGLWWIRTVSFVGLDYRQVYKCSGCGEYRTWCDGGTDSEFCDKCWADFQWPWWLRWIKSFLPASSRGHGCSDCAQKTY